MSENGHETSLKPPKIRDYSNETRLKNVNISKVKKRLKTILDIDSRELLRTARERKLNKDECFALCTYLKAINELEKQENEQIENLSDEELEKLMAKNVSQ